MFEKPLTIALLALTPLAASAYETGHLSCENVGQLAGQTLIAKQSGIPQDTYMSALNEALPGGAQVERKLVLAIATIIYQNDLPPAMGAADAYAVFQQDCLRDQAADGMRGQDDDAGDTGREQSATIDGERT